MMNTPAVMPHEHSFEDFLAIPDLAAGMIGEVLAMVPSSDAIRRPSIGEQKPLSEKSDIIADWFWHSAGSLKKSCILINRNGKGMFSVGQLQTDFE